MQKSYFFVIAKIFIAIIAMPTLCMELSLTTSEIPIIKVKLNLIEEPKTEIRYSKRDKHYCTILGIDWEENNNIYFVDNAFFKNPGETDELYWCWTATIPKFLPPSKIPNPFYSNPSLTFKINKFPYTLPNGFVQKLKKEKTITLANTLFAEPVKIIVELGQLITLEDQKKETQQY